MVILHDTLWSLNISMENGPFSSTIYFLHMPIFQFVWQSTRGHSPCVGTIPELITNQPAFATAYLGRSLDKATIHHVDNAINGHLRCRPLRFDEQVDNNDPDVTGEIKWANIFPWDSMYVTIEYDPVFFHIWQTHHL